MKSETKRKKQNGNEMETDKFGCIYFISVVFPFHVINASFYVTLHSSSDFFVKQKFTVHK